MELPLIVDLRPRPLLPANTFRVELTCAEAGPLARSSRPSASTP